MNEKFLPPPPSKFTLIPFLILLLVLGASARQAAGQQTQSQPNVTSPSIPLAHLYWFFLSYQHHLDNLAAQREAQGKDGSSLRNALQKQLQFSDADFAPIHESAERLVREVMDLDSQAAGINAAGASQTRHIQLRELTRQRASAIDEEINNLALALSPEKKAALDAFLPRFFHVAGPPAAAGASSGAQQ